MNTPKKRKDGCSNAEKAFLRFLAKVNKGA